MKKKYLKTCTSVLAVTAVLLSACGGPQQKNVGKTTMETAKLADTYIRIPMGGQLESLNAAMAAGILMYEASRQRRG